MRDEEDGGSPQIDSCTLIVRLTSGIELEYDLDPRRVITL